MDLIKLPHYKNCFGCGLENPKGLRLERFWDKTNRTVFANFQLDKFHNGFENIAHGGILATIVDEVLWWAVFVNTKKVTFTYKLELTFKKPVEVNKNYKAVAEVLEEKGRRIKAQARIIDDENNVYLEADAIFIETKDEKTQKFFEEYKFIFQ